MPIIRGPMSPAPADHVNAVDLAGRAAELERHLGLGQLPRLREAGAIDGTRVDVRVGFGRFEGRTTIRVQVRGAVMLPCQRCMRPCACDVNEDASLVVVAHDAEEVPGGYEPCVGDAERLSLTDLIEEQVLLGLPLVPKHADAAVCGEAAGSAGKIERAPAADDRQRPFADLRRLLDEGGR